MALFGQKWLMIFQRGVLCKAWLIDSSLLQRKMSTFLYLNAAVFAKYLWKEMFWNHQGCTLKTEYICKRSINRKQINRKQINLEQIDRKQSRQIQWLKLSQRLGFPTSTRISNTFLSTSHRYEVKHHQNFYRCPQALPHKHVMRLFACGGPECLR